MRKLMESIVTLVTSLVLLGALSAGAVLAIRYVRALFGGLSPAVASVTAIASAVALVSAVVIARAIGAASRRTRALQLREDKAATYQLLLDCWTNQLRYAAPPGEAAAADLQGRLEVLDRLLALYGAATTIRAHAMLRRLHRDRGGQHPAVQSQFGRLVVAIRRDLGTDAPAGVAGDLEQLLVA